MNDHRNHLTGDADDEQLSAADKLIDRAVSGAATPEEFTQLGSSELVEALRQKFELQPNARATNAAWSRLTSTIAKRESLPVGNSRSLANRTLERSEGRRMTSQAAPLRKWALAAALLLVIAGAITTWPFVTRSRGARADDVIVSEPGHSRTVKLADGTTVVLDAGSRIRVPRAFARRARDLSLDGAAYFVVTHDAALPFRVHVRDGVVEDVGTRFVVEAYAELAHATVSVAEGSVALRGENPRSARVALNAGDVGRLAVTGADRIAQHVDVDNRVAWMRGELVFTDTPLADALPRLSRWYDREIRVADTTLSARRLTARFRADQPADAVFAGVGLALGARVSQQGRIVTLTVAP